MVSFQSGYIFIQTDKTLYTPNTNGQFSAPSEKLIMHLEVTQIYYYFLAKYICIIDTKIGAVFLKRVKVDCSLPLC